MKRFQSNTLATVPTSADLAFSGATSTVDVDGNDTVQASATYHLEGALDGEDVDIAICIRPVAAVTPPTPLGGATALKSGIDLNLDDNLLAVQGVDILAAGSYTIGVCVRPTVSDFNFASVVGSAVVYQSSGALARPDGSGTRPDGD